MAIVRNVILAILALVFIAIASGAGNLLGKYSVKKVARDYESGQVEAALEEAVSELNAMLPQRVDEITTLQMAAATGKSFNYFYILEIDSNTLAFAEFRNEMFPQLARGVCTNPTMAALLQEGVKYTYHYRFADNQNLGSISISIGDC